MASAFIIFDNRQRHLTLPIIYSELRDSLGFDCAMSEWRFAESVVPQILVATAPPIALQLDEHPEIVFEEIQELLDSAGESFDEASLAAVRRCRSRVEVVSGEPTRTERFLEGGTLSHTPNVDVDSLAVQLALRRVANFLHGWIYDNLNGRWI